MPMFLSVPFDYYKTKTLSQQTSYCVRNVFKVLLFLFSGPMPVPIPKPRPGGRGEYRAQLISLFRGLI